ncbi:DUF4157 domain-containing protein [Flavivirga aquimarina]|uniref:DUF4157 domain-containing protein n=1 Tax=Flavivirga aquimarina TaxID=2027862 RepID=A0ABT8WA83_9FLAO|nr:DUF4157 domain-containing protein [Flavivirga aquimarina]MDO5970054.1 DUF4157 domain-containing protein [Flavivirga aquimarina]
MNAYTDKTQRNKSQSVANAVSQKQSNSNSTYQFEDNRPEAVGQRKLQEMANNSPQTKQAAQLQVMANDYSAQQQQPIQKKENNTGLPDNLKSGIENLSGYSMDDVKVHYNSDKPAQLQAHAYAQGTDIHLATGQGKHLPHEAWHVVQQKQGRVKPTIQMKGNVNLNDDTSLEKEADLMGAKALQSEASLGLPLVQSSSGETVQRKLGFEFEILVQSGVKKYPLRKVGTEPEDTLEDDHDQYEHDFRIDADSNKRIIEDSTHESKDIPEKWRNKTILELVTPPIDEFAVDAESQLTTQINKLVAFATAIQIKTENLTKETTWSEVRDQYEDNIGEWLSEKSREVVSYDSKGAGNFSIGRNQSEFEIETGSSAKQSLDASIQYTAGIDITALPTFLDKIRTDDKYRSKSSDKTLDWKGKINTLLNTNVPAVMTHFTEEVSLTETDRASLKGFVTALMMNLMFGKASSSGLNKNYVPILNRTDLADARKQLPANVQTLLSQSDHRSTIRKEIRNQLGITTNDKFSANTSISEDLTAQDYMNATLKRSKDKLTDEFTEGGGMEQIGPEDVGPLDNRQKGIVYENRFMKKPGQKGGRYKPSEWLTITKEILNEMISLNTRE